MSESFQARFAWASGEGKVLVVFLVRPMDEPDAADLSVRCQIEQFVEYQNLEGKQTFDIERVPSLVRQQIAALLETQCTVQAGVRSGGVKYIERPPAA